MAEADLSEIPTSEAPETLTARARRLLARGLGAAADLMLPPLCLGCREPLTDHDALCPTCWRGVDFIRPPLCDRLGLPMPFDVGGVMVSAAAVAEPPLFDRARAVAAHSGVMRDLVHGLKFRDHHDVRHLFARWLVEAGADLIRDADVVVPVPLGRWRLISRRFNQAAILASGVAELAGLAYEPGALVRTRATESQVGLTRRQRKENVAGAFAVPKARAHAVRGRRVLLIDDVMTTGATAGACARALKRAGAAGVDVLVLALVTDVALVPA